METDQKISTLNHSALLSRIKDSVNNREIVHPFKKIELPLFSSIDELEVISKYNEEFLYTLKERSRISKIEFKTIGVLHLGDSFLKVTKDLSRISVESHGTIFSEENFFSQWWNTFEYTDKSDAELRERTPALVLYFDENNKGHMKMFEELSQSFKYSLDEKVGRFPFKTFSRIILPSKFLFYLSW